VTSTTLPRSLHRPVTRSERFDFARRITTLAAGLVVFLVFLLLVYIGWNGIQIFLQASVPLNLIFSSNWNPSSSVSVSYGILPFITGTLSIMVLAAVISTPLSVGLSLFMAEIAPRWARSITQPAMEVFVGIPSVVYGWLGLTILVPFLRQNFSGIGFTTGFSLLAGALVLSLMILPTITSIAYDAFRNVPGEMRDASLALGTTRWQTIRHVLLPAASSGIATAIVLGMMRAAGEALAVQMVIGNRPFIPTSLTQPMTTLTSQIALDMGNAPQGPWIQSLWLMGLILLITSFAFVLFVRRLSRRPPSAQ
jgi:phosphate transport system permease protein